MRSLNIILVATAFTLAAHAQNCKTYVFKKGQKLIFEYKSYPLTFESDMSMVTGDTKYKVKNSIAFNEKIASGKIVPKSTIKQVLIINTVSESNGKTEYGITVEGMASPVNMSYYCGSDSLAIVLYGGRMPIVVKGDTTGVVLYGAIRYPYELKVGNRLKGACNVMVISDNSQIVPIRRAFSMPFNAVSTSPADYYRTFTNLGPLEGTLYNFSAMQPGLVIREEKMTVLGKECTAYVIGTETWARSFTSQPDMSFPEMEEKILQLPDLSREIMKESSFEPGGKRLWKKNPDEMMDVNKYKFSLSYKEEWFVPGMGVVKNITYDASGAIVAASELKSIE